MGAAGGLVSLPARAADGIKLPVSLASRRAVRRAR